MSASTLTQARLRELLEYDPETGMFTRRRRRSNQLTGSIAGGSAPDGRRYITVDYIHYEASRLAWFYIHGEWPKYQIDHENRIKSDDRLDNLRDALPVQNVANREKFRGKSPYIGVRPRGTRWTARVVFERKCYHFGTHDTQEEAAKARDVGAIHLFGEYAVLNFQVAA